MTPGGFSTNSSCHDSREFGSAHKKPPGRHAARRGVVFRIVGLDPRMKKGRRLGWQPAVFAVFTRSGFADSPGLWAPYMHPVVGVLDLSHG